MRHVTQRKKNRLRCGSPIKQVKFAAGYLSYDELFMRHTLVIRIPGSIFCIAGPSLLLNMAVYISRYIYTGAYGPPKAAKDRVSSVPSEYKFKHGIGLNFFYLRHI